MGQPVERTELSLAGSFFFLSTPNAIRRRGEQSLFTSHGDVASFIYLRRGGAFGESFAPRRKMTRGILKRNNGRRGCVPMFLATGGRVWVMYGKSKRRFVTIGEG